ncbi:MAG: Omp28-related outer membrane protein [Candidatus Cloacimonetes bacterium]|nr:Omp28-related outer membrane protein [Candidatus Cloacimonadota bacterium]
MNTKVLLIFIILVIIASLQAVPRDMVVVEIGTGTWCQYCPGAAMGADDLVSNRHRAAILENHNGDNYANVYSNARNTYYNITGYPTAFFDGLNSSVGGSYTTSLYPTYRTRVQSRLNVAARYTISATGTHTGNTYNVAVTVSKVETDTNTNIKLHGVLTESGIQQNWQGQTHLEYVVRLMAPSATGTDINFSTNTTQTINLTFEASPAWNAQHFEFVFFLQNNSTKEILQGCKYSLNALENVFPVSTENIDFGNVDLEGVYMQSFTVHNWWTKDMNIDISIDNMDYFISPHTRDPYTIPFMDDVTYDIFFIPNSTGISNGVITITTDNSAYPTITIPVTASVTTTSVEDAYQNPISNKLMRISPNPFSETARIHYTLPAKGRAELTIYNVKGNKVFSQAIHGSPINKQSVTWSGKDNAGNRCPSGIYLCKLSIDGKIVASQKMIKTK